MQVTYRSLESGFSDTSINYNWTAKGSNGITASFPLYLSNVVEEETRNTHFAFSGMARWRLTNVSNTVQLYLDAAYGHQTVSIMPSVSITGSGATVTVSFSTGISSYHCAAVFSANYEVGSGYIYAGTVYGRNGTGGHA